MIEYYYSNLKSPDIKKISASRKSSWTHVVQPTEAEIDSLVRDYGLEDDLLRDALDMYESPRVEQSGEAIYVFTRYPNPGGKQIATEPLLLIYLPSQLISIMRQPHAIMDNLLNGQEQVITTQPTKTFLQILSETNKSYEQYVLATTKRILSFRTRLSRIEVDNRLFIDFVDIEEDLNEFLAALEPRRLVFRSLESGKYLPLFEEDKDFVEDLRLSTDELIEIISSKLKTISNTREAYATILANNLNKTFRRLTSISIFVTIPAVVAALYGMNLRLPLANNPSAFWYILAIVMVLTGLMIWTFRKLRWL